MQFHFFSTVARYEMKTLLRSWFFRIFAILALLIVTVYSLVVLLQKQGHFWIFKTLPGALPYATLLIVNLGQAVVAIFLSSEFLKQDQKNDSAEVIYVRSISNTTYILGKFAGILLVFGLFNIVVLGFGSLFTLVGDNPVVSPLALVAYPLLISLPTLVFIVGLSFSLMVILRNQAVVFILLLGYIALTVFYLNNKFYHALDYIGYNVPLMYSSITGFGDLSETIIHRLIYLLLGFGLISFTVYRFSRLPNKDKAPMPLLATGLALIMGASMMGVYIQMKISQERLRKEVADLNDRYADYIKLGIAKCDIDLIHQGAEIEVEAKLEVENHGDKELDTLILRLNPSLNVDHVSSDDTLLDFSRQLHLIKIACAPPLKPRGKKSILIAYHGGINDNIAFADLGAEEYDEYQNYDLLKMRKRSAFLDQNYVCLTSVVDWYPSAGPGYTKIIPYYRPVDFTWFTLTVRTSPNLIAISQGLIKKQGEGEFLFAPEYPLSQVSLTIGDFVKRTLIVDSLEFNLYTVDGNDYYKEFFADQIDSLPGMIRDIWRDKRDQVGISYPFNRFTLVEVPVNFNKDRHKWSSGGDALQPEMIFYPEKGVLWDHMDIQSSTDRLEQEIKRGQGNILPETVMNEVFRRMTGNFVNNHSGASWFYNLSPVYYAFTNYISSPEYPVLNLALQEYLKDKKRGVGTNVNQIKAHRLSIKELVETAPDEELNPGQINDIVGTKGVFLLKGLQARFGEKEFGEFLADFSENGRYRSVGVTELDSAISKAFGRSIIPDLDQWFHRDGLPAYIVKDIRKLKEKNGNNHEIRFKISNLNPTGGYIETVLVAEGRNRVSWYKGTYFMEGSTAKDFRLLVNGDPSRLDINVAMAENVPADLNFDLSDINVESIEKVKDTVTECSFFADANSSNDIIIDNEDAGFSVVSPGNKGYLKKWVDKNRKEADTYDRLMWWNPPSDWTKIIESGFYGKFVHSAVYAASGDGEIQAHWETPILNPGYYNIYFHYTPQDQGFRRNRKKTDYNLEVRHDAGIDAIIRHDDEFERGWNLLGSYYLSSDTAVVILSNRSDGNFIVGDAIKWVKTD